MDYLFQNLGPPSANLPNEHDNTFDQQFDAGNPSLHSFISSRKSVLMGSLGISSEDIVSLTYIRAQSPPHRPRGPPQRPRVRCSSPESAAAAQRLATMNTRGTTTVVHAKSTLYKRVKSKNDLGLEKNDEVTNTADHKNMNKR
ncbi:hypothetical protein RND71_003597 [Anisodus tanguticus]|uniref:Uncharacterized protein n=1 Tax=Anisodus tanguticus TaxID=243964 RepID=A0AAE1SYX0_9SOLA|nr:hypothetical protein RND71_003597 [Anisodus tanguticus]